MNLKDVTKAFELFEFLPEHIRKKGGWILKICYWHENMQFLCFCVRQSFTIGVSYHIHIDKMSNLISTSGNRSKPSKGHNNAFKRKYRKTEKYPLKISNYEIFGTVLWVSFVMSTKMSPLKSINVKNLKSAFCTIQKPCKSKLSFLYNV